MNVILFGATGMIGAGALLECLDDPGVERVLAVVRRPTGRAHPKLREVVHGDFLDFTALEAEFAGYDACLYCLGVSSAGMTEADYRRITLDTTVAAARSLLAASPSMRMCFISGAGTDVGSRTMWRAIKGQAEQALLAMPWRSAHMFRPGAILPERGVVSGVPAYRWLYRGVGWMLPAVRALAPNAVVGSAALGQAMLRVGRDGHAKAILEVADIVAASKA